MERVGQFIYENEVSLPLSEVKYGELFFVDSMDEIAVYKKTERGNVLIKTVDSYFELSKVQGINLEPSLTNSVFINP